MLTLKKLRGDYMYRPTYVKVNMNNIYKNIVKIKEHYDYEYYIGVVKANCYGHGIGALGAIIDAGCNYLAVATLEEALQVRLYTNIPIICLGVVLKDSLDVCADKDITITINSLDYYKEIKHINLPLKVHLKLNTGMNRLGIGNKEELNYIYNSFHETSFILEGIYSHIFDPSNTIDTEKQFNKFYELCHDIDLSTIKMIHIAASETLTKYPKPKFINGVRLGLIMYGFSEELELDSTFSLYSKIVQINEVDENDKVGYSGKYIAKGKEKIAVIQVGYADGILRSYRDNIVYINDKPFKIVGNVCMDMLFVKIDDTVNTYDEVVLLKDNVHIMQTAKHLETIPYEILCGISNRVPRIYQYDINP